MPKKSSRKVSASNRRSPKRLVRLRRPLSLERIAQLSNDLSEDIASGDVKDWRTVAAHYRDRVWEIDAKLVAIRSSVSAMVLGHQIIDAAKTEMQQWLASLKSEANDGADR